MQKHKKEKKECVSSIRAPHTPERPCGLFSIRTTAHGTLLQSVYEHHSFRAGMCQVDSPVTRAGIALCGCVVELRVEGIYGSSPIPTVHQCERKGKMRRRSETFAPSSARAVARWMYAVRSQTAVSWFII